MPSIQTVEVFQVELVSLVKDLSSLSHPNKRSTPQVPLESELIVVDDYISHMIWANHFLEAQDYMHPTTVVYKDNRSAILLEQNGILSSTRRTKYINVRYYFIKEKVNYKELTIKWYPTGKMVSDYNTQPLSGKKLGRSYPTCKINVLICLFPSQPIFFEFKRNYT